MPGKNPQRRDVLKSAEEFASTTACQKERRVSHRPAKDPCAAGLKLLRWQVLFLQGARNDPELYDTAPAHGIDPEFWSTGAHEFALRLALRGHVSPQPSEGSGRKVRR